MCPSRLKTSLELKDLMKGAPHKSFGCTGAFKWVGTRCVQYNLSIVRRNLKYIFWYLYEYVVFVCQIGSYHEENGRTLPHSEPKLRRARVVLWWGTTWEGRVFYLFVFLVLV